MTEFLDEEDLVALVSVLGAGPVRDVGLLSSAAARPRASFGGQHAYPDLAHQSAALLHSLARHHALVDGNKRLAWLATVVFADLNQHAPALGEDEAFELVMAVAAGELDDVDEIAARLRLDPRSA